MPSPEERRERTEQFRAIGREFQELARDSAAPLAYGDFASRLQTLHALGLFPDDRLVSAAAQAIHRSV